MLPLDQSVSNSNIAVQPKERTGESLLTRLIKVLCSVRFGVTLLVLLGLACLIGMLVMQQNVDGFERYFAELTPSQRLVYGRLGLFNIYHAWYFNALLAVLSMNIILASIDRFPKTWAKFSKPNITVPLRWLREQKQTAAIAVQGTGEDVSEKVAVAMKTSRWRKVQTAEKNGIRYIFGESGRWNRFGAYPVHVGLLTIFIGGFLTAQLGSTGQMPLAPGESKDLMSDTVVELDKTNEITRRLPFRITATDIQQKLIKKEGSISAMNTIDWITRFNITDETGTYEAMVQMNRPLDYRGYRFFQASFIPVGRARNITVNAKAADGSVQTVTIPRDGTAKLSDGTTVNFSEFRGNFRIGPEDPNEDTSDYPNPGAVLQVTGGDGTAQTAYAFGPQMADLPVASRPVAGYTFQLTDFEKAADQHVLSIQRDPGATVVYVGFVLLVLTLIAVFFFSHQRVWAAIEPSEDGTAKITFGGDTNRNSNAFDEKFKRFINALETKTS